MYACMFLYIYIYIYMYVNVVSSNVPGKAADAIMAAKTASDVSP